MLFDIYISLHPGCIPEDEEMLKYKQSLAAYGDAHVDGRYGHATLVTQYICISQLAFPFARFRVMLDSVRSLLGGKHKAKSMLTGMPPGYCGHMQCWDSNSSSELTRGRGLRGNEICHATCSMDVSCAVWASLMATASGSLSAAYVRLGMLVSGCDCNTRMYSNLGNHAAEVVLSDSAFWTQMLDSGPDKDVPLARGIQPQQIHIVCRDAV